MRRKPRFITILTTLLFVVGVGVMLYPKISDWYVRRQLQQTLSQYNTVAETEQADYSEMWKAAEEYNRKLAQRENQFAVSDDEMTEISGLLNPMETGMMGRIDIDRISVHLPLYQGTDEADLQAGAGWWIGTSLPTGGESTHCVITAHTGLVRAKMFTDLDQMETGDTFSLTILDRILTYEVDQILVTDPNEIEPLLIVDGEDYCTLYTCYPYGVNTERLLVRGRRIPTPEMAEMAVNELNAGEVPLWGIGIAVGAVAATGGAIFWHGKRRKAVQNNGKTETDKKEGNGS